MKICKKHTNIIKKTLNIQYDKCLSDLQEQYTIKLSQTMLNEKISLTAK